MDNELEHAPDEDYKGGRREKQDENWNTPQTKTTKAAAERSRMTGLTISVTTLTRNALSTSIT
ncbi:MAG: hypothetical protein UY91_C0010G0012 [Parcubacteria group bacterium GW2011_GWB1_55_9]|nr:MAG: hypothetical protein UY91_C0010G0012 [Parcubacteria group bacterium GW2011_GWB1_55_9]